MDKLVKIELEGSIVEVCERCVKFGRRVVEKREYKPTRRKSKGLKIEELIPGYGSLIKSYREKIGLTRKEFAERLAEKESVIKRVEEEKMEPTEELRRKIERFLRISLLKKYEEKVRLREKKKKLELTVGDVVELK